MLISNGISWLAYDDLKASDLFQKTFDGRRDTRRMAAVEWYRKLNVAYQKDPEAFDVLHPLAPRLEQQERICRYSLSAANDKTTEAESGLSQDIAYQSAIIGLLGFSFFKNPAADCLWNILDLRSSVTLQGRALMSLAVLSIQVPPSRNDMFVTFVRSPDASLRKVSAFAAGILLKSKDSRNQVEPSLLELLSDYDSDVRWNAAFAFARWGTKQGQQVFEEIVWYAENINKNGMLVSSSQEKNLRELTGGSQNLTAPRLNALEQAFALMVPLEFSELNKKLSVIAQNHPHLKVRLAAKNALTIKP